MVIGNLSCMVSATLFGLSDTYLMAILSRAIGGLFNGIIGGGSPRLGRACRASWVAQTDRQWHRHAGKGWAAGSSWDLDLLPCGTAIM